MVIVHGQLQREKILNNQKDQEPVGTLNKISAPYTYSSFRLPRASTASSVSVQAAPLNKLHSVDLNDIPKPVIPRQRNTAPYQKSLIKNADTQVSSISPVMIINDTAPTNLETSQQILNFAPAVSSAPLSETDKSNAGIPEKKTPVLSMSPIQIHADIAPTVINQKNSIIENSVIKDTSSEISLQSPDTSNTDMRSYLNNQNTATQHSEGKVDWKKKFTETTDEIKAKYLKDVKKIHGKGHWSRGEMRDIGKKHYIINQAIIWIPPVLLGIASFAVGAAAIAGTAGIAIPVVLGIAAAGWAIYSRVLMPKIWAEREAAKLKVETDLTSTVREFKSDCFDVNAGFSQNKEDNINRILMNVIEQTNTVLKDHKNSSETENSELYEKLEGNIDDSGDLRSIFEIIFDDKNAQLSPSEIIKLRQILPTIVIEWRKAKQSQDNASCTEIRSAILEALRNEHQIYLNTHFNSKKYSEHLNKNTKTQILAVKEIAKTDFKTFLTSEKATALISAKKFSIEKIDKYRVYYTKESNTIQHDCRNNGEIKPHPEIVKHIQRAIMTRGEIQNAKHGTDSLQNLIVSMVFDDSTKLNSDKIELARQLKGIIDISAFERTKNNTREAKAKIIEEAIDKFINNCDEKIPKDQEELFLFVSNDYLRCCETEDKIMFDKVDRHATMAADEADFLFHENTACRNPYSAHDRDAHGIIKAWNNSTGMLKDKVHKLSNGVKNKKNTLEHSVINLPFNDRLDGHSTHFSPFHDHDYLKTLDKANLINYRVEDSGTGLSRPAMEAIHKKSHRQIYQANQGDPHSRTDHYYSQHQLSGNRLSSFNNEEKAASFGPAEENNSRSVTNAIKRFNSSRDIQVIMAALFKKEATQNSSIKSLDFPDSDNDDVQWSQDPLLKQMNHTMNVSILHTELKWLESSIFDLKIALQKYSKLDGSLPVRIKEAIKKEMTETSGHSENNGLEHNKNAAQQDIMEHQKEIKRLTAEVADRFHSLFKTQIDYQIAYSKNDSPFDSKYKNEMNSLFEIINTISQDANVKQLFQNTHNAVNHNRNRFTLNIFNNFKGRARLPIAKMTTFTGVMRHLLYKTTLEKANDDDNNILSVYKDALKAITNQRFAYEDTLLKNKNRETDSTETYENLEYLDGLTL